MQAEDGIINNDAVDANLVSRIFSNDPSLTHLDVQCVTDFRSEPVPDWWLPHLIEDADDPEKDRIIKDQVNSAIEALHRNHTITSVSMGSWVSHVLGAPKSKTHDVFAQWVSALFQLTNLEEAKLDHAKYFMGSNLADALRGARKLKRLNTCVGFQNREDLHFIESIHAHPSLNVVHIRGAGFASPLIQTISTNLIKAFLSLRQLTELSVSDFQMTPEHFVELVQMPNLRHLVLQSSRLRDEHIIGMAVSLMKKNGHLECVDISRGRALNTLNRFGQEGWEALFRLVRHDPLIQIRATAFYIPPPPPNRSCIRRLLLYQSHFTPFTFWLNDRDAVRQHLQKEEMIRFLWLKHAGFERLLQNESHPEDAEWIEVMAKVSKDSIALFHILRVYPLICGHQQPPG